MYHLIQVFIFLCICQENRANLQQPEKNAINAVTDVCKNAVRLSKQPSFYIVDANAQTSVGQLIQSLHKNSFATTFCNHLSYIQELIRSDHPKNIVFFVSNINKILDLILASSVKSSRHLVNGYKDGNITKIPPLILDKNSSIIFDKADEARSIPSLPNYCIQVHPTFELIRTDIECNYELSINQAELQHGSILSDPVHHATRDLSNNKIWNSKNHLIFVVSNSNIRKFNSFVDRKKLKPSLGMKDIVSHRGSHKQSRRRLQFLFKFIWRFFKGVKTVICLEANCFYYNPVLEKVEHYPIADAENRVDFEWDDWNAKIFSIQIFAGKGTERASMFGAWDDILADALQSLQMSKNIYLIPFRETAEDFDHYEDGQKYGLDIIIWQGFSPEEEDPDVLLFDTTATIEYCNLCFMTPRAPFVPQFLVICKSFDPSVWLCFFFAVLALLLMQYSFQLSQIAIFNQFYTQMELFSYSDVSALLTVWEYFLCGTPMKLLLGRLFTGKILFLIFSFAVLIFSTVIQSRMFELLSLYVRYPEIDTLEDFTESEIFARVPNIEAFSRIMEQWPQHESLKKKLIQDYHFYENMDSGGVTYETGWSYEFLEFLSEMSRTSFTKSSSDLNMSSMIMNTSLVRGFLALQANELVHMNTDAYVLSVPDMFLSQENFLFKSQFAPYGIEVHRVKECLVSYPFSYRMPKNSFFLEPLNRKIVQLLESGLVKNRLETLLTGQYTGDGMDGQTKIIYGVEHFEQAVDGAPRPFSMLDLQIAFISLGIGHLFAFLTFIAELLINYNETAVRRFFTEIQKSTTYFVAACIMRTLRR